MSDRSWRVLIADDHPVFRSGLRAIVDSSHDMTVVAEAENGAEAVELAALHEPDLILMDLHMPVLGGIEATRRVLARSPEVRVLVLTMIERDDAVMAAMRAGSAPLRPAMRSSRPASRIGWRTCWRPAP
jgi:DNA-binding NarL/FixJ family response regulator